MHSGDENKVPDSADVQDKQFQIPNDVDESLSMHVCERKELAEKKAMLEIKKATYEKRLGQEGLSEDEKRTYKSQVVRMRDSIAVTSDELKKLDTIIEQERAFFFRKKHYDKYRAFRNIRELLKSSDIKLGQIEKEAGCQVGYMSRLEKPDNATEPSLEFLVTASQMLGISLDILLNVQLSVMTPTEIYVSKFLKKLIQDTEEDKLAWIKEPLYVMQDIYEDEDGRLGHPLFESYGATEINVNGMPYQTVHTCFPSNQFGRMTEIMDDCFHLELKNHTFLYIMPVAEAGSKDDEEGKCATELWMYDKKGGASFLCSDSQGSKELSRLVFDLWAAVVSYDGRPKVNKEHRSAIDAFMKDDFSNDTPSFEDDDTLPF